MSYAQTCCRTKIKLTLALTNRKCRRNWFKTTQNGQQNNPLGVANKGGLETKFEETAGQMTVGHIRSYKFVPFGLKGLKRSTHICLVVTRDILIDTFIFLLLLMSELVFFTAPLLVCEMSSL